MIPRRRWLMIQIDRKDKEIARERELYPTKSVSQFGR